MFSDPLDTFEDFYRKNRCPGSPENPGRALGLAEDIYRKHYLKWLSASEVLSELYIALVDLFEAFDPDKYHGRCSIEHHFINMLGNSLRDRLRRAAWPRTDRNRKGDPDRFEPRRHLGMLKKSTGESFRDDLRKETVRDAVMDLPDPEQTIIRQRYWKGATFDGIAGRVGGDRSTVERKHKGALDMLRDRLAP
jgi:RNA polymerase sigma factor (sigma-70 family)